MIKSKGFTLIELMVVIAIIAILTTLGFMGIRQAQAVARDSGRVKIMSIIRSKLEQYYSEKQTYPQATVAQGFATMATALVLDASVVDPSCGTALSSGGIPFDSSDYTANSWTPGTTTGRGGCTFSTQPTYSYNSGTANTYTLTLIKEGGGTIVYNAPL